MAPLPFDVRSSKSSLLKLPNDHSPHPNQGCSVACRAKQKWSCRTSTFFYYWARDGKEGVFLINFAFKNFIVKSDTATSIFRKLLFKTVSSTFVSSRGL